MMSQDVLLVGQDAQILGDFFQQLVDARRPSFSCSRLTNWPSVIRKMASACTAVSV